MGLRFRARHTFPSGFELDAAFEAGEGVTALCGPSGNGKSTVLAILAGTLRPDEAFIELDGRVLVDTKRGVALPPEERGVGFVFQDHLLFPHLDVETNLRFGQKRKPLREVDFARVVELLAVGDLLDRMPTTLSGGQRQRIALGRALLRGPALLLLDEPLTGLDAALKGNILADLQRIFAEWRIPTLFVSHDVSDIDRLATQIVSLRRGRVEGAQPSLAPATLGVA